MSIKPNKRSIPRILYPYTLRDYGRGFIFSYFRLCGLVNEGTKTMYSGRQKTVNVPPLQLIALLFGVGLFLLLLILAGKIAFERARESTSGLAGGLTHGADREISGENGTGSSGARGLAHRSSIASGPQAVTGQNPPFSFSTVSLGGNSQALFANAAQQQAAKESLAPLHELLENVRRFDTTVLSGAGTDGSGVAGQIQTGGAATPFDVPVLLDSLEAQTALVAHPYRFPEPLQDDAAQATREVYIYLETVRGSGLGQMKPSGDDALVRATAQKHLEKGAQLVARMDALAQGGTNPGDGALAATGYISPLP